MPKCSTRTEKKEEYLISFKAQHIGVKMKFSKMLLFREECQTISRQVPIVAQSIYDTIQSEITWARLFKTNDVVS